MRIEKWGGLSVRVVGGTDGRGGGDGPVIVFNHGFGASGDDLVPLASELARVTPALARARFLFPEGLLGFQMAPGFGGESRAWWMIDLERFQRAQLGERPDAMTEDVPEGLPEARARFTRMLEEAERALGFAGDALVIGGFSQGAMLALDVALHTDRKLAGVVFLSGSMIAARDWTPRLSKRKGLPVFMSHGMLDALLPFTVTERLQILLRDAGLQTELVAFRGAHEIPRSVLDKLAAFLTRILPSKL